MARIEAIGTNNWTLPRFMRPALVVTSLAAVVVALFVGFLSGPSPTGTIGQAYAATTELQSYRMSGSSVPLGGTPEVVFDWEFVAPDSYHGTMSTDGLFQEFILVGDEQYIRDSADATPSGSVVIVTDSMYSPVPSREGTLRFLDSLIGVEQLPDDQIEGVDTSHYVGIVDLDAILDEQLVSLDPESLGYLETLAFVELQRTAKISVELWIGYKASRIQQMSLDVQFPIISTGPEGAEQQGSSGFSTVVKYSDFNSDIEIKRPVTVSGELSEGWKLADNEPPEPIVESELITP